jgi:hypothetical protein
MTGSQIIGGGSRLSGIMIHNAASARLTDPMGHEFSGLVNHLGNSLSLPERFVTQFSKPLPPGIVPVRKFSARPEERTMSA